MIDSRGIGRRVGMTPQYLKKLKSRGYMPNERFIDARYVDVSLIKNSSFEEANATTLQ